MQMREFTFFDMVGMVPVMDEAGRGVGQVLFEIDEELVERHLDEVPNDLDN